MGVTLEDLRKYRNKLADIAGLDAEIEASYNTVSSPVPSEIVAGKSSVRPTGDSVSSSYRRRESLERKKAKLVEEVKAIEAFVDECDDQMARAIMRLHFLAGKSWRQTAVAVYDYRYADGENCRKYIWRYFKHL